MVVAKIFDDYKQGEVKDVLDIIEKRLLNESYLCANYKGLSSAKKEFLKKQIKLKLYLFEEDQSIALFKLSIMKSTIMYIKGYTLDELRKETSILNKKLYKYEGYPLLSKDDEIELLEKLCLSDSYFAETFREHFKQMKNNILNDFPILTNINLKNK